MRRFKARVATSGKGAGAGAMLVACRMAGLSALEAHYAGLVPPKQTGASTQIRLAFKARG
jgi:hypothetical protein